MKYFFILLFVFINIFLGGFPQSLLAVSGTVDITASIPGCGDGVVQSGEQCDSGSSNGVCPATCSTSCTTNSCADASDAGGGGGGVYSIVPGLGLECKIADFNCDEHVNILDLSILLYYIENPSSSIARYDLNQDSILGFTDISILFYYWDSF